MNDRNIRLQLLTENFAVCKLPQNARLDPQLAFAFWAQTPEERSLVCLERDVPGNAVKVQVGMRCLRVAGVLDLALIGILSQLAAVLAQAEVPLFAVSTWNTDYLLIPGARLEDGIAAFRRADITVERADATVE